MTVKIKAVSPRLSDEETDPVEQDETEGIASSIVESNGWLPWSVEDIADIKRIIYTKMPLRSKEVFDAFLQGFNYTDRGLTEKRWRYHFQIGLDIIKKELKL